jgi:hypothetical protein
VIKLDVISTLEMDSCEFTVNATDLIEALENFCEGDNSMVTLEVTEGGHLLVGRAPS